MHALIAYILKKRYTSDIRADKVTKTYEIELENKVKDTEDH